MMALAQQGGASALPTLPPIRRGRVRKAQGVFTGAGEMTLNWMASRGEAPPSNVVLLNPLPEPDRITKSPELLLTLMLYGRLAEAERTSIRHDLGILATSARDPCAAALAALLAGRP